VNRDEMRYKNIGIKSAPRERNYAVIIRVFKAAHDMAIALTRVHVEIAFFKAIALNLFQLRTLQNHKEV